MEKSFSDSVARLEKFASVGLNQETAKNIRDINRFFNQDDVKAYLLGQLLVDRVEAGNLDDPEMKGILLQIEELGLTDYFKGKRRAKLKDESFLNWVILGFGIIVSLLGVFRYINSSMQVGFDNRFGIMSVKEGGLPLLMGILLMVVFFVRNKYSVRQKTIFDKLDNKASKSA